jgi:hypothetical protein
VIFTTPRPVFRPRDAGSGPGVASGETLNSPGAALQYRDLRQVHATRGCRVKRIEPATRQRSARHRARSHPRCAPCRLRTRRSTVSWAHDVTWMPDSRSLRRSPSQNELRRLCPA